jgi:hypothetical protein
MSAEKKPIPRRRLEPSLASVRSAITNNASFVPDTDGRSAWMRRLRDLISAHTTDLGGDDYISEAERVLVRRASMITLQLELMEHVWAVEREGQAGPKSIQLYQQCSNTLRRLHQTLGLRRRQRDVTTLGQILREGIRRDREAADIEEVD